jgi:hypothetical protein
MAALFVRLRTAPAQPIRKLLPLTATAPRGSAIEQWFLVDTRPLAAHKGCLLSRLCHQLSQDKEGDREIYRGILSTQIKLVKSFSLCTSLIGNCSTYPNSHNGNIWAPQTDWEKVMLGILVLYSVLVWKTWACLFIGEKYYGTDGTGTLTCNFICYWIIVTLEEFISILKVKKTYFVFIYCL